MKPKEGTILTVIRVIAEDSGRYVVKHPGDLPKLLDQGHLAAARPFWKRRRTCSRRSSRRAWSIPADRVC